MRHFVSIKNLERNQLEKLLDETVRFASSPAILGGLEDLSIASLFFENSTRTRVSFQLAASRLGANLVNVDLAQSSQQKGESVWDTVATLQAMGIDQFIVRTSEVGLPDMLAQRVEPNVSIINAGEANISHPSQALLDLVTLRQYKGDIDQLSVAIVGDISHSRVARSFVEGARLLGCKDIRLIAPPIWQVDESEFSDAQLHQDLKNGIDGVDVIMALRIQHERMINSTQLSLDEYREQYSISKKTLALAKPDTLVMHPGPINRNVEITDEIADGPRSVILKQVEIGVPARMAIINSLVEEGKRES